MKVHLLRFYKETNGETVFQSPFAVLIVAVSYDYLSAAVSQVQSLSSPLVSVADDRDSTARDRSCIRIPAKIDLHVLWSRS